MEQLFESGGRRGQILGSREVKESHLSIKKKKKRGRESGWEMRKEG